MQFRIAETTFKIQIQNRLLSLPTYSNFLLQKTDNEIDIYIEILNDEYMPYKSAYVSTEHTTYMWKQEDGNYILWFSKRGSFLDESQQKDIWCLAGDRELRKWKLFIPNLDNISDAELNCELEKRPWLQRLYACYCMNRNEAIMHGAVCNINGKGCLFLGESGVGKSTICSIINKYFEVYSDDRFVIKQVGKDIVAYGTPWNIKNKEYCCNKSVEIKSVFFLKHGDNKLQCCKKNYTLLQDLLKQILHASVYSPEDLVLWKLSIARIILNRVQCFKFEFVPDISCLKYILCESHET